MVRAAAVLYETSRTIPGIGTEPSDTVKPSLEETHPEIAVQGAGWDTSSVTHGSGKKMVWQCALGHQWTASVASRTVMKSGCPFCAGSRVLAGFNDLAHTHPDLAKEASGWDPTTVLAGNNRKLEWRCIEGHTWAATVKNRTGSQKSGCPFCAGSRVLAGFNDLEHTYPDLAKEASGWDPTTVLAGSNKKREWRCEIGHAWWATPNNRTGAGHTGCPICRNQKVLAGFNDLAHTHPHLAPQAHGWDPTTVLAGSNKKREWRCEIGHVWRVSPSERTGKNRAGCPVCANRTVLVGFNDLAHTHPDLAAQAHGWDPTTVVEGNNLKFEWRCSKGHTWWASVNNRASGGRTGCPVCANHEVLAGYNDLAFVFPGVAAEAYGWDPSTVLSGAHQRREWRCARGHLWTATVASRTHARSGCPSCAQYGFDPNKPGWLYFLAHPRWGLLQVGITNVPQSRLRQHKLKGWVLLELRGPMEGNVTYRWEQDILRMLRQYSVALGPKEIAGRFSGYTESWIQDTFPARSLDELLDKC